MRWAPVVVSVILAFILTASAQSQNRPHDVIMKEVAATFASLKTNLNAKSIDGASQDTARLTRLFKEVEEFWTPFKTPPPINASKAIQAAGTSILGSIKEGKFDAALTTYGNVSKQCDSCHDSHRWTMPDKSYRIRP